MLAFVPALGVLFQGLIVAVLGLLDDAFDADVAPGFEAEVMALEEQEQARDSAVAVAERMDAQEVQAEGGDGQERMQAPLLQSVGCSEKEGKATPQPVEDVAA